MDRIVPHCFRQVCNLEPVFDQISVGLGTIAFLLHLDSFEFTAELVNVFGLNVTPVVVIKLVQSIVKLWVLEVNGGFDFYDAKLGYE